MTINLTQVLHDYKNEEIKEEVRKVVDGNLDVRMIPLTLKSAILTALNSFLPGEIIPPDVKVHLNVLSIKIWENDEIEFSLDDIILIKERVGIIWNSPDIYVGICTVLDIKSN